MPVKKPVTKKPAAKKPAAKKPAVKKPAGKKKVVIPKPLSAATAKTIVKILKTPMPSLARVTPAMKENSVTIDRALKNIGKEEGVAVQKITEGQAALLAQQAVNNPEIQYIPPSSSLKIGMYVVAAAAGMTILYVAAPHLLPMLGQLPAGQLQAMKDKFRGLAATLAESGGIYNRGRAALGVAYGGIGRAGQAAYGALGGAYGQVGGAGKYLYNAAGAAGKYIPNQARIRSALGKQVPIYNVWGKGRAALGAAYGAGQYLYGAAGAAGRLVPAGKELALWKMNPAPRHV